MPPATNEWEKQLVLTLVPIQTSDVPQDMGGGGWYPQKDNVMTLAFSDLTR